MPDAGCRMPDAGCRMPDAGCRMPDAGCRMPDAGCRMPDAGCRMPDAGCRMPDAMTASRSRRRTWPPSPDPFRAAPPGACAVGVSRQRNSQRDRQVALAGGPGALTPPNDCANRPPTKCRSVRSSGAADGRRFRVGFRVSRAARAAAVLPAFAALGPTLPAEAQSNNAPQFSSPTAARTVPEHSAAGTGAGDPVTASEDDNDPLTYSLEGTDASSFDIDSSRGRSRPWPRTFCSGLSTTTATGRPRLRGAGRRCSHNESREPYLWPESPVRPARATRHRTPSVRPSEPPRPAAWAV